MESRKKTLIHSSSCTAFKTEAIKNPLTMDKAGVRTHN
ncbi:hypothetical protein MNBD_GAMMA11-20 [hydrothermal vent metagenome]|uniref:Uncharacterized protein n=1 Tax=hydrothermal vent metagenome TaxID=652676 RepID=A0A3B0WZN6_9ZZZZ